MCPFLVDMRDLDIGGSRSFSWLGLHGNKSMAEKANPLRPIFARQS